MQQRLTKNFLRSTETPANRCIDEEGREGKERKRESDEQMDVEKEEEGSLRLYLRVLDRRPVLFYESQYFTRQLDSRGGHR